MNRRTPLVLLALAALLTSACGGEPADSKPTRSDEHARSTAASSGELRGWVSEFCAADEPVLDATQSGVTAPHVEDPSTESDRGKVQKFLKDAVKNVGEGKRRVEKLPEGPTPEAEKLVSRYGKSLGKLHSKLSEYKGDAGRFPAAGLGSVYRLGRLELVTFEGAPFPGKGELATAREKAAGC